MKPWLPRAVSQELFYSFFIGHPVVSLKDISDNLGFPYRVGQCAPSSVLILQLSKLYPAEPVECDVSESCECFIIFPCVWPGDNG